MQAHAGNLATQARAGDLATREHAGNLVMPGAGPASTPASHPGMTAHERRCRRHRQRRLTAPGIPLIALPIVRLPVACT